MTQKITANEIFVRENGARIKTRCERRHIDDAMIALWAQQQMLDVGDTITVQCMNHERDTVYWQRRYLVAARHNYLQRTENLMGDVKHQDAFKVRVVPRDEDWWAVTPEPVVMRAVDKGPVHKWWVVDADGKALAKGLSEEEAKAVAAGDVPAPESEAA